MMARGTNEKPRGDEPHARTIRVSDTLWDALAGYAKQDKRTISAEIAWVLEEYVQRREREEGH